jgi:hypothetical protein
MNVSQAQVSRIENQADLYLSTLRSYIEAMGGELQIRVAFPGADWAEIAVGDITDPSRSETSRDHGQGVVEANETSWITVVPIAGSARVSGATPDLATARLPHLLVQVAPASGATGAVESPAGASKMQIVWLKPGSVQLPTGGASFLASAPQ